MAKPPYLSTGWTDAITRANKALAQISESQLKMAQQAARTIEAYRLDWLQDLVKTVQRAREALVEAWPPNWQEMSPERISNALDLAEFAPSRSSGSRPARSWKRSWTPRRLTIARRSCLGTAASC
jgi:hypothetical protein